MYHIGIDVGSTYTKYSVLNDDIIISLFMEKTPIRQKEYFEKKDRYNSKGISRCNGGFLWLWKKECWWWH